MKILLLNDREPFDETLLADISSQHELICYQRAPEDFDFNKAVKTHSDADVIITTYNDLNAEVLSQFKKLKLIVATTTASEYIDKDYTTEHGIQVFNNPGYTKTAVAEHLLALTLTVARRIPSLDRDVKQGDFMQFNKQGFEFAGKNLGILGMGNIGQTFAKLASGLNMNIGYYNRSQKDLPYTQFELDELLSRSDIIAITLPLNAETREIINKETLANMKPGSIMTSISPDGIFNMDDLHHALSQNKLFGAGLDLHKPHPELYKMDNVVITPTKAWYTAECMQRRTLSWLAIVKKHIEHLQTGS